MKRNLFLIVVVLFFASCSDPLYNKMKEIPDAKWDMNYPLKFDVEVNDTTKLWDFYVLIRHNTDYAWSNIYTFVTTISPDDSIKNDTIEFLLSYPDGKWIGKGNGDIRSNEILISKNFVFPEKGLYSFEFQQGMRDSVLVGICDFGIRIIPSK